ncbi:MAG TPA: alternative ribosome rescue aminoacyl-tRNA hydrolase ArfB [Acidimicrobiales bacterium]|nr:alternative ribosome rescue aminoacyl-tRNA hydrolase ArfB [Acidimicrobiales bacterium]
MSDTAGPHPKMLHVTRNLAIPLDELRWRFTTSGGPGGQHANRSSTRVEVLFDVERSASLGPRQRARLLERFGATVKAASGDQRSQARNREVAMQRLAERLSGALRTRRGRVATTPSAGARARRLEDKRRRSQLKRQRAGSREPDS